MNLERIRSNTVKVICGFSVPAIIAMVLTSLISVVDGYFAGNYVGKEGIAALNLGLPILYLYLALGLMISVGGVAIAGISLGKRELERSNNVFNQTIMTTLLISVFLSIVILLFFKPIMGMLHVGSEVETYFIRYYRIMIFVYPFMILNSSFGMFIRGEGKPQFFMMISILSVVCNIILDYLFVRWFLWGVIGIAVASLISVIIGVICSICFFCKKSNIYKFKKFVFSKADFKDTILNGGSEFIGEMSMSIAMYAYNWVIIKHFGVDGVAAFTIVGYTSYIFSMIIIGFGQGVSPLISFTYGAKEFILVKRIRRIANGFVLAVGIMVMLFMLVAASWYSQLFVKNENVTNMVYAGIRIFAISFLFSGVNTITSMYFTSIGKAKESAVISSSRGLVILLICIFTFPVLFGITGVWLVGPLTEGITILLTAYFIVKNDVFKEHQR